MRNPESPTPSNFESKERKYHLLGKVSVMRHGHTKYTNVYPDLTQQGLEEVSESAKKLKGLVNLEEDVVFLSSPAVRAQGTTDKIKQEIDPEAETRVMNSIRSVHVKDMRKAVEMLTELTEGTLHIPDIDRAYALTKGFADRPDVWQSAKEVEDRFFRNIEYSIRSFERRDANTEKLSHIVAVSHFEPLNHFITRVFNIDLEKGDLLTTAELINMSFYSTDTEEDKERIKILVEFRDMKQEIFFNRKTRDIEIIE